MTDSEEKSSQPGAAQYVEPLLGVITGLSMMLLAASLFVVWLVRGVMRLHYPTALFGFDRDSLLALLVTTAQRCHDHVAPEINCALPGAAALGAAGLVLVALNVIAILALSLYIAWSRRWK